MIVIVHTCKAMTGLHPSLHNAMQHEPRLRSGTLIARHQASILAGSVGEFRVLNICTGKCRFVESIHTMTCWENQFVHLRVAESMCFAQELSLALGTNLTTVQAWLFSRCLPLRREGCTTTSLRGSWVIMFSKGCASSTLGFVRKRIHRLDDASQSYTGIRRGQTKSSVHVFTELTHILARAKMQLRYAS